MPDATANFMRTLQLAVLYSESVHAYSPVSDATFDFFESIIADTLPSAVAVNAMIDKELRESEELRQEFAADPSIRNKMSEGLIGDRVNHPIRIYIRSCVALRYDLRTLKEQGVLVSMLDAAIPHLPKKGDDIPAFFKNFRGV